MGRRFSRFLAVGACAVACAAAAATSLWSPAARVRTADQNGDGRPDIWRTYDREGRLAEVAVDTNFDGRADVQERYEGGVLVRRELDRDFDDQVDLIQEFDPASHQQTRSHVDVDFDGTADLLVLFRDGQPVFSTYAHPVASVAATTAAPHKAKTAPRTGNDQLAPLADPFRTDFSVRAIQVLSGPGGSVGLSTSGGLPASGCDAACPPAPSSALPASSAVPPASSAIVPYSPRGPPSSFRLA